MRTPLWIGFCILTSVWSVRAAVISAGSCSQSDVQTALNSAVNGDTVIVPSGSCTWTTAASMTHGIILQGAGQGSTNITVSGTDWLVVNPSGGVTRITGFTVNGTNAFGAIQFDGTYTSLRMDHMTFTNLSARAVVIGYNTWYTSSPAIYGLFDHITFSNTACIPFALHYGSNGTWLNPDDYGSASALYVEDSTFTFTAGTWNADCDVWDGEHGARYVIRHNTISGGSVLGHDTGSTPQSRGQRKYEIYANTMNATNTAFDALSLRGGTGVTFDNNISIGARGFQVAAQTEVYRNGRPGGSPFVGAAGSGLRICSNFRSHCSGGDHRACGVSGNECTGIGPCVDTCTADNQCPSGLACLVNIDGGGAGGYPVRDQTGVGQDDAVETTHLQHTAPVYWWNNINPNTSNPLTTANIQIADPGYIAFNREIYVQTPSFNGTVGVGRGVLASRPATCTPRVGYFATDQGRLYQCTATNVWSPYYSSYPYPHPLQTTPPEPPANLRAVVR